MREGGEGGGWRVDLLHLMLSSTVCSKPGSGIEQTNEPRPYPPFRVALHMSLDYGLWLHVEGSMRMK